MWVERPATARSDAQTIDIPAPAAHPGTPTTTGTGHSTRATTKRWNARASSPT